MFEQLGYGDFFADGDYLQGDIFITSCNDFIELKVQINSK